MNKNIKKYSGLSMVMGTVLVLSGCGHVKSMKEGKLADISPTLLDLLGIAKPQEMNGNSLLVK